MREHPRRPVSRRAAPPTAGAALPRRQPAHVWAVPWPVAPRVRRRAGRPRPPPVRPLREAIRGSVPPGSSRSVDAGRLFAAWVASGGGPLPSRETRLFGSLPPGIPPRCRGAPTPRRAWSALEHFLLFVGGQVVDLGHVLVGELLPLLLRPVEVGLPQPALPLGGLEVLAGACPAP